MSTLQTVNSHNPGPGGPFCQGEARLGGRSARWEFVTPEVAALYLKANRRNRKLIEGLADRYGAVMAGGDWLVTHQGIAFDEGGSLVDGQHRLEGVVRSGVGQWLLVVRGLDRG